MMMIAQYIYIYIPQACLGNNVGGKDSHMPRYTCLGTGNTWLEASIGYNLGTSKVTWDTQS